MTARILFADDSPHAQRIGLGILSKEGFEVELVVDGQAVYPALEDFDPDVVIVDVFLPSRSGYEICHWIKTNPRLEATRPLAEAAHHSRGLFAAGFPRASAVSAVLPPANPAQLDPAQIQAAVAMAMEAALPAMIKEVTERVLVALGH